MVQFSILAWPTRKLGAWAKSQPPWTRLPMARAVSGIEAPHPALLPAIERYGEPTCHVEESDGRGYYLRLEWRAEAEHSEFAAWSSEWLALVVQYRDEAPFESDLSTVSAWFNLPDRAPLTAPDSDDTLPHQAEADCPDGYEARIAGFATVPHGTLFLTLYLPWSEPDDEFVAYDAALVGTLGKFADTRYRCITAGGARQKLTWKR